MLKVMGLSPNKRSFVFGVIPDFLLLLLLSVNMLSSPELSYQADPSPRAGPEALDKRSLQLTPEDVLNIEQAVRRAKNILRFNGIDGRFLRIQVPDEEQGELFSEAGREPAAPGKGNYFILFHTSIGGNNHK
jgi:hypothetical protein